MLVPSSATTAKNVASAKPAPASSKPGAEKRWTRPLLAGACVALMVILACAPARNHEYWLHIGLGKALIDGRYAFGIDPLLQQSTGYFANPAWLPDFLAAATFDWFGTLGLDLVKLLLVGGVALLLLLLGGFRRTPWLACGVTLLALVALGPWLAPRPLLLSFLFLGLFLYFLQPHEIARAGPAQTSDSPLNTARAYWPLWTLQILWVNCDEWFILGPAVIFLHALSGILAGQEVRRTKQLLLVFAGSLVACLVNPHHFHIFQLPMSFGFFESYRVLTTSNDPGFRNLTLSPLQLAFRISSQAQSAGGIALILLVTLQVFAFAVNFRRIRLSDVLVWLFFLAIGLLNVRAIPFFVIATAPIAARNLQSAWGAVAAKETARRGRAVESLQAYGRFVVASACVLLLAAAWPGWLQGTASEPRRLDVVADASLKNAAETVARWRRQGDLAPESRGFNLTPDIASYFAAFAGGEKMFFDARLSLLSEPYAKEVLLLRAGLLEPRPMSAKELNVFRDYLRRLKIGYVVIHANQPIFLADAIARRFSSPQEWPLLYLEGPTLIFGWRDPAGPDPRLAKLQIDPLQWVVNPPPEQLAPAWSGQDAVAPSWWQRLRHVRPEDDPFAQEANLHVVNFEALRSVARQRRFEIWTMSAAANFILTPATAADGLIWSAELPMTGFFSFINPLLQKESPAQRISNDLRRFFMTIGEEPPLEHLILAVRAARRGIEANPQSAASYLALGNAYVFLNKTFVERDLHFRTFPHFRRLQAAVAFQQALTINPKLSGAHLHLIEAYRDMGFLDLALDHARIAYEQMEKEGKGPEESLGQFEARLKRYADEAIKPLADAVDKQRRLWETGTAALPLAKRAAAAFEMGLAKQCLDLLLAADIALFDEGAILLELRLLQATGRVKEARTWIDPKDELPEREYLRLKVEQAMVVGDYEKALGRLEALLEVAREGRGGSSGKSSSLSDFLASAFGQTLMDFMPVRGVVLNYSRLSDLQNLQILAEKMIDEAELHTLAGLLAVEAGDPRAYDELAMARNLWLNLRGVLPGGRALALPVVEEWFKKVPPP